MKNKSLVLGVIAVVIVAAVVAVVAMGGKKSDNSTASTSGTSNSQTKSSSSSESGDTSKAVSADSVDIEDYSFSPQAIKVKVGAKVTWTNHDSVQHDVVADNESADAPLSDLLSKGESYTFTFNKAGTYTYHCSPHPYMKATVIVE